MAQGDQHPRRWKTLEEEKIYGACLGDFEKSSSVFDFRLIVCFPVR